MNQINATKIYIGGNTSRGYWQAEGANSSHLGKIGSISFNHWAATWDISEHHGIRSTDSNGSWSDCVSINSYNDITLRLDTNGNNNASYVRIMNNSAGNNVIHYLGHDGTVGQTYFIDNVGIDTSPRTDSYKLNMGGSVHMNNNSIDYVSQLHFHDNVRFYDDGNSSYLNFKYGSTDAGGIKIYNGSGTMKGYLYADINGFGLLDNDGQWALRTQTGTSPLELRCNNNTEFSVYSDYTLSPGSSRAPKFYDSNDTGYYVDPAGTSYLNYMWVGRNIIGVRKNYADTSGWYVGNPNGQPGYFGGNFGLCGTTSENAVAYGVGPYGMPALIWQARNNDTSSDGDGGWGKTITNLDDDNSYMSVVYVRRVGSATSGTFYHGCHGSYTDNLNGTSNGNPYFTSFGISDLPQDVWCVSIGYIHASSDSSTSNYGACYRLDTGERIYGYTDYKMKSGATTQSHRTYLYYSTDSSSSLDWYNPGFYEINGTEPNLAELTLGSVTWHNGNNTLKIYNSAGSVVKTVH